MTYFVVKKKSRKNMYSFGVLCGRVEGNEIIVEREINDVTTDYIGIVRLVRLCNELNLDIIHIDDVIEDFIG